MKTFIGTEDRALDEKNRVFIPAEFRALLGDSLVLRLALSAFSHLECFVEDEFESVVEGELKNSDGSFSYSQQNAISRMNSKRLEINGQNRITLSADLLKRAKIEKKVIFVGAGKHFEIWNPEIYEKYCDDLLLMAIAKEDALRQQEKVKEEYMKKGMLLSISNTIGLDKPQKDGE